MRHCCHASPSPGWTAPWRSVCAPGAVTFPVVLQTADNMETRVKALFGDETPRVLDLYRKAHPDLNPYELFVLISTDNTMGVNSIKLAERKAALIGAFDATMKDDDFLAEAKKLSFDIRPVDAATIDKMLAEVYQTPKDVIARATKAISSEGQ